MKKIAIVILITISSVSCNNNSKKIDYGNILNNCFSENEIAILNEVCSLFEAKLTENYPKEPIAIKYKLYLKDISELNEPTGFIKNSSNTLLDKLKNSSVFDKIWIKYSAKYYEDDSYEIQVITNFKNTENDTEEIPKDFYITNPKGAYIECLLKNQKNIFIEEYLLAIKDIGEISPQILAQGLFESLTEADYDDKAVRLIIALNLFYEMELNISE